MLHGFSPGIVSQGASAYLLEQSLLFDGASYLNRTPSVAGNRKAWTYSVWFKPAVDGTTQHFFGAGDGTTNNATRLQYQSTGTIQYIHVDGGSVTDQLQTTALFLDPSAWYHMVVAVDTTQATDTDRVKLYINGSKITSFQTTNWPALNMDTDVNNTNVHRIGTVTGSANFFDGLMALPQLIDGAALSATDFGETDDGFWNPIEYVPSTISDPGGVTYVSNASSTANATGYTFSGQAIGTANANRQVIVGTSAQRSTGSPQATPTVTIGGVSATEVVGKASTDALYAALFVANVPSGTTADIVVTWPQSSNSCDIGVWAINTANFYVRDIISSNASPGTDTLTNMSGDGFVVAYCGWTTASADVTWVGATENFDNSNGESANASGASSSITSDNDLTITATYSATNSNRAMVAFAVGSYDGLGKNGGAYYFADTADFGKDVNYTGDTSVTFTDSSVNSSGATAYTFSSQAIGTASSDRVVAVGVSAGNSPAGINTLTVGGLSAVKAIDATNSTETELWYASVPSGTTADIVVTFSSGKGRCGIGVWALTGVTGVGATNTSTSSTATLTVSGRAKDIILAVYGGKDHASVTFTGLTEDYDEDISGAGSQYQAGGSKKLTATGSNTITVTPNTGATEVAAVSAVFLATGNNGYVSNNFTASDQLEDTPTDSADDGIGNFATWDPTNGGGHTVGVPTEGNLQFTNAAANYKGLVSTIAFPTSGKWGVQFTITGAVSGSNDGDVCIVRDQFGSPTAARSRFISTTAANYTTFGLHMASGDIKYKFNGGSSTVHYNGAASATSDVYEFLFDADNGYFDVKENGVAFGTQLTGIPTGELYWFCADMYATGILVDFGQQGYVPSESGYLALATQNLPDTHPLYTGTVAQYRAGATIQSIALTGNSGGNTNYTFRSQIPASAVATHSFTKVRVKMEASTAGDIDIDAIYIDAKATSGNAWDYQGTQVALTLNGDAAFNIPTGGSVWSDWVELSDNGANGFVVGFDIGASNGDLRYTPSGSGYSWHIKASTDAASVTAPAGLSTTASYCALVTAIEVQ